MSDNYLFVDMEEDTAEEKSRICRKICLDIPPGLESRICGIQKATVVIGKWYVLYNRSRDQMKVVTCDHLRLRV